MDKNEMQKLIQQGIQTFMRNGQFNLTKIQAHEHNGVDTVKIQESNILNSPMYSLHFIENINETFYIQVPPNFKSMTFYGVAGNGFISYDPITGIVTATNSKKSSITGEVQMGQVYGFTQNISTNTAMPGKIISQYYQACNSTYLDTTNSANLFVSAVSDNFIYAYDGTKDVVALSITSIQNNLIAIKSTLDLADGWYVNGFLLIS